MATMFAVHKGWGTPEICETREDAEETSRWYTDHPYWHAQNESGHAPGEIEEIPAKLPTDAGIRTVYDIVDADMGGYCMGYYPATIRHGHANVVGDGPFCADCARAMLPDMEEDETFIAEPEYESPFGEYCEGCNRELCPPHCQICLDRREEGDAREWYTDDSHGYVCPRCMAQGRIRATTTDPSKCVNRKYHDFAIATRLAPGVYDVVMCHDDGTYNGRGLFYAPSCGHHVKDVWDTYNAAHAR